MIENKTVFPHRAQCGQFFTSDVGNHCVVVILLTLPICFADRSHEDPVYLNDVVVSTLSSQDNQPFSNNSTQILCVRKLSV